MSAHPPGATAPVGGTARVPFDIAPTIQHLMLVRGVRNFSALSRLTKKTTKIVVGVTAISLMNRGHRGNRKYREAIGRALQVSEAEIKQAITAAPWDVLEDDA